MEDEVVEKADVRQSGAEGSCWQSVPGNAQRTTGIEEWLCTA